MFKSQPAAELKVELERSLEGEPLTLPIVKPILPANQNVRKSIDNLGKQ
jgi:hypothetical protein